MAEQKKETRNSKTKLPLHWVEEEGFEFAPTHGPAKKLPPLTDTAFLLKSKALPRPTRFPNS